MQKQSTVHAGKQSLTGLSQMVKYIIIEKKWAFLYSNLKTREDIDKVGEQLGRHGSACYNPTLEE